jgi:hypothetical protein
VRWCLVLAMASCVDVGAGGDEHGHGGGAVGEVRLPVDLGR